MLKRFTCPANKTKKKKEILQSKGKEGGFVQHCQQMWARQ